MPLNLARPQGAGSFNSIILDLIELLYWVVLWCYVNGPHWWVAYERTGWSLGLSFWIPTREILLNSNLGFDLWTIWILEIDCVYLLWPQKTSDKQGLFISAVWFTPSNRSTIFLPIVFFNPGHYSCLIEIFCIESIFYEVTHMFVEWRGD